MPNNILDAIITYSEIDDKRLDDMYSSDVGIKRVGERLEYFIKDLICNSVHLESQKAKDSEHAKHFSYPGGSNNPPDGIIKNSDAIEVKKTKSYAGTIPLNSSTPHQTLSVDSPRITDDCRTCEENGWEEKDMVYILGKVTGGNNEVEMIWIVYGDCWSASDEVYKTVSETVSEKINEGVNELDHGQLNRDTNEIGRVNEADPHGRTSLRIRGMWQIDHPANYLSDYVDEYDEKIDEDQPLFAVMRETRFREFPKSSREAIREDENISLSEIQIPDPDQTDQTINCVLIEST